MSPEEETTVKMGWQAQWQVLLRIDLIYWRLIDVFYLLSMLIKTKYITRPGVQLCQAQEKVFCL